MKNAKYVEGRSPKFLKNVTKLKNIEKNCRSGKILKNVANVKKICKMLKKVE